jgi:hypothetical protein
MASLWDYVLALPEVVSGVPGPKFEQIPSSFTDPVSWGPGTSLHTSLVMLLETSREDNQLIGREDYIQILLLTTRSKLPAAVSLAEDLFIHFENNPMATDYVCIEPIEALNLGPLQQLNALQAVLRLKCIALKTHKRFAPNTLSGYEV